MKLLRYKAEGGPRLGALRVGRVIDLEVAGAPWSRMIDLIEAGPEGLAWLSRTLPAAAEGPPLDAVELLAPIERPGKYLAIGLNYADHIAEVAEHAPPAPLTQLWFNKQTSCLAGPFDEIDPGVTSQLDYEAELAVVIGGRAKGVPARRALEMVFGYTVANDVSARDWQFHSTTYTVGKSFDTHGPIGPWIVTRDEIPDPQRLHLRALVNGEVRQSASTAQMIHSVADQIAYLSTAFTLEPGDLLSTGTPGGVGMGMSPPVFLQPGDVVRCEIDAIGAIENRVSHGRGVAAP